MLIPPIKPKMARPQNRSKVNVTKSILTHCPNHWIRGDGKTSCDGLQKKHTLTRAKLERVFVLK